MIQLSKLANPSPRLPIISYSETLEICLYFEMDNTLLVTTAILLCSRLQNRFLPSV